MGPGTSHSTEASACLDQDIGTRTDLHSVRITQHVK
jgi:hypothetical protein